MSCHIACLDKQPPSGYQRVTSFINLNKQSSAGGRSHDIVDHASKSFISGLGNPNWALIVYFQKPKLVGLGCGRPTGFGHV